MHSSDSPVLSLTLLGPERRREGAEGPASPTSRDTGCFTSTRATQSQQQDQADAFQVLDMVLNGITVTIHIKNDTKDTFSY